MDHYDYDKLDSCLTLFWGGLWLSLTRRVQEKSNNDRMTYTMYVMDVCILIPDLHLESPSTRSRCCLLISCFEMVGDNTKFLELYYANRTANGSA
jgi:hypothetical protein